MVSSGQQRAQPTVGPGEQYPRVRLHGERRVGDIEKADVEAQDEVFGEVEIEAATVHRSWIIDAVRGRRPQQQPGAQIEKSVLRGDFRNGHEPFATSWQTVVRRDGSASLIAVYAVVSSIAPSVRGAVNAPA